MNTRRVTVTLTEAEARALAWSGDSELLPHYARRRAAARARNKLTDALNELHRELERTRAYRHRERGATWKRREPEL